MPDTLSKIRRDLASTSLDILSRVSFLERQLAEVKARLEHMRPPRRIKHDR